MTIITHNEAGEPLFKGRTVAALIVYLEEQAAHLRKVGLTAFDVDLDAAAAALRHVLDANDTRAIGALEDQVRARLRSAADTGDIRAGIRSLVDPQPAEAAPGLPRRHMDGIDAGIEAERWLEGFIKSIPPHPGLQIERMKFVLESGATPSGSIILLWRWNTLLAQATMVRDSANFTVLTIQEFQR